MLTMGQEEEDLMKNVLPWRMSESDKEVEAEENV